MRRMQLRAQVLVILVAIGLLAIGWRAIQFQVWPDARLIRFAKSKDRQNTVSTKEESLVSRGAIVDRNGSDLALSIVVKSFFANPKVIENPRKVARAMAPLLGISVSKLTKLLQQDRYFVWLKREVDERTAKKIEALNLEGIYSRKETKRVYPHGDLGRAVIGAAGHDGVGLEGIEKTYDAYLRTSDQGPRRGIRDALGRLLLFYDYQRQWFESHHVVSTIDLRLQRILEDELRSTLKERSALSAQGIMVDPQTGEVLAMASLEGQRADANPIRNRSISDIYEPGSTFKVILAAAALEHLQMSAYSQIFGENGAFRVGNHLIREFAGHKYDWLSLQELLEVSSNIAAAKIGLKMGASSFASTIKKFGFGEILGIDLPGEAAGIVRPASSWKPLDLATMSFGQGIAVTPLQLLSAVSAVANGGILVRPYVVSKVVAPKTDGSAPEIVFEQSAQKKEIMSSEQARALTDMLIHVTDPKSTGAAAHLEGYPVAGKTGTSQKLVETTNSRGKTVKTYSSEKSIVSFIGYAPAYDPAFVLLVLYDEPKGRGISGGSIAAPSFRRIASRTLSVLGIPPQSTFQAKKSSKILSQRSSTESFIGRPFQDVLREIRKLPEGQRARFDLIGVGTAIRQEDDDERIKIYFQ